MTQIKRKLLSKIVLSAALPLALLVALVIFKPTPAQATGETGLWHFDETSGTTAADSSGNNNTGTLINGPIWTTGKSGNALQFDGVDDYVDVGNGSSLKVQDFTIEMWLKPTGGINEEALFGSVGFLNYGIALYSGWLDYSNFIFSSGYGTGYETWAAINLSNDSGQWVHFTITRVNKLATVYKNGIATSTHTFTNDTDWSSSGNFYVGAVSSRYSFGGLIDEVRIYNRALSSSEILADYNVGASDITLPSISIASPTNNQAFTNSSIIATGTASDNIALSKVEVKLNSGTFVTATGTTSWSIPLTLASGSNTVLARATDTSNNTKEATITVTYAPTADITPPIISNIVSFDITSNNATISWITDELSDSQIEYGATTSYGLQTTLSPTLVTNHSQSLASLTLSTIYHYRIKSKDAVGNLAISTDRIFTTVAVSSEPIPAFHDDFSDNRFYNRTGTDPWGRTLPEWKNPYSTSCILTLNSFDANNKYINMHSSNCYYSSIEADFPSTKTDFFKLEYDYRSLGTVNDEGGKISVGVYGPGGSISYDHEKNGHVFLGMSTSQWNGLLMGWGYPATGISQGASGFPMLDYWHHVEVYRFPDHSMIVLEDGNVGTYDWSDRYRVAIPIGTSDANQSANWEVWDNPRLYRGYPNGADFPDTTPTGGFNKIKLSWYNGNVAVTNIKLWDYNETDPKIKYNDVIVPGTGAIAGRITRSDVTDPIYSWKAGLGGAIVTNSIDSSYTENGPSGGIYSISRVSPGTYTIRVSRKDFTTATATVTVYADKVTMQNLVLDPLPTAPPPEETIIGYTGTVLGTGTINGTVRDLNNISITGVTIRAGNKSTVTDSNGAFTLSEITEGRFAVLFGKAGYESKTLAVNLIEGTIKSLNVLLSEPSTPSDTTLPAISISSPRTTPLCQIRQLRFPEPPPTISLYPKLK